MSLDVTIITFLISLAILLVLMPPFIKLMEKYKILDKAGGRKIHTGYTAHMGGIIIFIAFVVSVISMSFLFPNKLDLQKMLYVGIITAIMLFVGIRDDLHNISPWGKLFFEILVGILMSYIGIRLTNLNGFLGIYQIPTFVGYGITICFFVVVVNAYNLIDGIDGQAGMQALNVFFFCMLFCILICYQEISKPQGNSMPLFLYISSWAILGSIVGFLRYNWQKARVFMGDSGSLFIGTLITIFIITTTKYAIIYTNIDAKTLSDSHSIMGHHLKACIAPFIALFYLPMADTLRVFIARARKGKSPFSADKGHIHHMFLRIGYSHQRCTLTTFGICISFCISIIGIVLAFFFNDNVCIPLIIASWFGYVYILRAFIKKQIKKIRKNNFKFVK